MKIVWLAYDRANYTGGPIINTIRLLPKFKELGHEPIALIAWQGEKKAHPNADYLISLGIECRIIKYPYYSIDFVKWILQQIEDIQPDIFVPNISIQGCFAGRWIKKAGIPIINTLRSLDENNIGRSLYFSSNNFKKWNCSYNIAVSEYLKFVLTNKKDYNNKITTTVIPSGVPLSSYLSNHNSTEIHIAYSGRLVKEIKRFPEIFELFLNCSRKIHTTYFHIFGNGDDFEIDNYKRKVKYENLNDRFIFHGSLKGDEYKRKLASCHYIFLLSDFEGMPGALMDGMSCGLIPVSSNFKGVEELIINKVNGFIVDDPFNSFDQIENILNISNSTRELISIAAIETITKNFTITKTASKWIRIFENLTTGVTKKRFTTPFFINLPNPSSLLKEDRRKSTIKARIKQYIQTILTFNEKK